MFHLLSALDVSKLLGFFQFSAQLGKAASISELGLLVEHLARVTQVADMDPRLVEILSATRQALCGFTGFVIVAPACDSTCEIEHMEFDRGVAQQMSEVPESLSIS